LVDAEDLEQKGEELLLFETAIKFKKKH